MDPDKNNVRQIPEDMKNPESRETGNPIPSDDADHCLENQRNHIAKIISNGEQRRECFKLCSQFFCDFAVALGDEINKLKVQKENIIFTGKKARENACTHRSRYAAIDRRLKSANILFRLISRIFGKCAQLVHEMKILRETVAFYENEIKKSENDLINIRMEIKNLRKVRHDWFQFAKSMNNGYHIPIDEVVARFNKIQHAINISLVSPDFRKTHEESITMAIRELGTLVELDEKQNLAS